MASKQVLVTGGAGFIGSHIVDALVDEGHYVRILDNLDGQVHPAGKTPAWVNDKAEFQLGDVRSREGVKKALEGVEVVFHEAAAVGVGQSMYEIEHYTDANSRGTAMLLDEIVNGKQGVKKMLVAASMSSYGEGLYKCEKCGEIEPELRPEEQMKHGEWELKCPKCGKELEAVPTPEKKTRECNSIYALTKEGQERQFLMVGKTYGIKAVSLRYFNAFGPRQSLSNPYTGVAAIFMSRVKNRKKPVIYEDGLQSRDFISVYDIARANLLAMESNAADYNAFNVGSGNATSIKEVAEAIAELCNSSVQPEITNKFRKGDVRHCFADASKIKSKLGFEPSVSFKEGMKGLIEWATTIEAEDKFDKAVGELKKKGLL